MGQEEFTKTGGADRILPRHEFDARVTIEVQRDHKTRSTAGWARDLSENGLGAFVGAELILGEVATLRIPVGNQEELLIPAQVSRKVGTEYGFQFTALSMKQRDQIRRILSENNLIPFAPTSN